MYLKPTSFSRASTVKDGNCNLLDVMCEKISKAIAITVLCMSVISPGTNRAVAQGMQMTEELVISSAVPKKDVKPETLRDYFTTDFGPAWGKNNKQSEFHFFSADRGNQKGNVLLVFNIKGNGEPNIGVANLLSARSNGALKQPATFLDSIGSFSRYRIIGGTRAASLPVAGILGIHYIKVKPERAVAFEKFIREKVHPAVSSLLPDMQLLYYKEIDNGGKAGTEGTGNYITIFTLQSPNARDRYWPEGKPETAVLKDAFKPLGDLAKELASYFVEGTYLLPESGGAAAYFESRTWTDFVHSSYLK
jgi:hypothetical protein